MDNIKQKAEELLSKFNKDDGLVKKFQADPVGTVEDLLPDAIPDEQVDKIVDLVKSKLTLDSLSGAANKLKGLFGK